MIEIDDRLLDPDTEPQVTENFNRIMALVDRSAPTSKIQPEKNVTVTENGESTILPTSGYDGMAQVNLTVNVPQPTGTISIDSNGNVNVNDYEYANVYVPNNPDWESIYAAGIPSQVQAIYDAAHTISEGIDTLIVNNNNQCTELYIADTDLTFMPDCWSEAMQNATDFSRMFAGCLNLIDVGNFDMTSAETAENMFNQCANLSDDALLNILMSLNSAPSLTTKTLAYIGLDSTQISTCTQFDIWNEMVLNGWTTGQE